MKDCLLNLLILLIVLFAAATSKQSGAINCRDILKNIKFNSHETREKAVADRLKELVSAKSNIQADCVDVLVRHGLFDGAEYLVKNYFLEQKIDLQNAYRTFMNSHRNRLDEMLRLASAGARRVQAPPAIKWAQSYDELAIFVKFAHRVDSPGCLQVDHQNIRITENNELKIEGSCITGGSMIEYNLLLPLAEQAEASSLSLESGGGGTVIVKFKKKRVGIWDNLWTKGYNKTGKSIGIWWELKDGKYKDPMKQFARRQQVLDDEEDKEGLWKDAKSGNEDESVVDRIWKASKQIARSVWSSTKEALQIINGMLNIFN